MAEQGCLFGGLGCCVPAPGCTRQPVQCAQGETSHWTRLFSHFEEVVAKHVGQRADVKLQHDPSHADGGFPVAPVVAMLRTTAAVLDNCSNKHQFRAQQARPRCASQGASGTSCAAAASLPNRS